MVDFPDTQAHATRHTGASYGVAGGHSTQRCKSFNLLLRFFVVTAIIFLTIQSANAIPISMTQPLSALDQQQPIVDLSVGGLVIDSKTEVGDLSG